MEVGGFLVDGIDLLAREATLFAAIWFLVGGIDDLLVDLIYGVQRVIGGARTTLWRTDPPALPEHLPRIAVFIAAWDESAVIGAMLEAALRRFDYPDYRLYVGTYPNDPETIEAVARIAEGDDRVRMVIGPRDGPTTKADCLNALWRAMQRDELEDGSLFAAIAIHDAEDLVHPLELRVFATELARHDAVQLPVLPLRYPGSRFVSGHYLDEFAEAHGKQLLVRQSVGASMPLAGVGCAIRRNLLDRIAEARGGAPFDAASLTEDYELGLTIRAMGGRCTLARVPECPGGPVVAVRAYFPARLDAAVRQKSRWLAGIALAGWDRTGWGRLVELGDHWMRMRDRRATLAMPVLAIAYCALVIWGAALLAHGISGTAIPAPDPQLEALLLCNLALLTWRLGVRALFVWRAYGWREALLSLPRVLVANYIALLAARRALFLYWRMLRGAPMRWDKTQHHFPTEPTQAPA